jgi:hypothetical protein
MIRNPEIKEENMLDTMSARRNLSGIEIEN